MNPAIVAFTRFNFTYVHNINNVPNNDINKVIAELCIEKMTTDIINENIDEYNSTDNLTKKERFLNAYDRYFKHEYTIESNIFDGNTWGKKNIIILEYDFENTIRLKIEEILDY